MAFNFPLRIYNFSLSIYFFHLLFKSSQWKHVHLCNFGFILLYPVSMLFNGFLCSMMQSCTGFKHQSWVVFNIKTFLCFPWFNGRASKSLKGCIRKVWKLLANENCFSSFFDIFLADELHITRLLSTAKHYPS